MASASMSITVLRQLRTIGLIEGLSFVVLLLIAMPLKYFAGMPQAVRFVGMAHGLLFVLYIGAALHAAFTLRWPLSRTLAVMAAAVLPAGPFVLEGSLRREERALAARATT
jgi:integral membrane protein